MLGNSRLCLPKIPDNFRA